MIRLLNIVDWFVDHWFGDVPLEGTVGRIISTGENIMGAKVSSDTEIIDMGAGGFGLFQGENLVGNYKRRRDAVRGAQRRGLMVV